MKISGKSVADEIAKKLQKEIRRLKTTPALAIILAGEDPASSLYVDYKIKRAKQIGVDIKYFEFKKKEFQKCLKKLEELDSDQKIHGIIIQYPIYQEWDFDALVSKINPKKDVDGFRDDSQHFGATAMGVWEMLTSFAILEGFNEVKEFLKDKKIVLLGRGQTAGGPIRKLLESHGVRANLIHSKTENPNKEIKSADVIISATGIKHIINESNIKKGSYVIGVGVGKEKINGEEKIYGDIHEEHVARIAKLYCPTIGGIGPLTIVCLLKNVISSAKRGN